MTGIGGSLKLYDVLLPFHGEDKFVEKKEDQILPGNNFIKEFFSVKITLTFN